VVSSRSVATCSACRHWADLEDLAFEHAAVPRNSNSHDPVVKTHAICDSKTCGACIDIFPCSAPHSGMPMIMDIFYRDSHGCSHPWESSSHSRTSALKDISGHRRRHIKGRRRQSSVVAVDRRLARAREVNPLSLYQGQNEYTEFPQCERTVSKAP
jgi:hypothetical protein